MEGWKKGAVAAFDARQCTGTKQRPRLLVLRTLGLYSEKVLPAIEKNQIPGRFQQLSVSPACT
jgi:hypothetical protein